MNGKLAQLQGQERSYDILTGEGTSLRRNRSHLKPISFDIPIMLQYFNSRTSTLSQSEITRNVISGSQHPPKVKYFYNNDNNFLSGPDHTEHPPTLPPSHPPTVLKLYQSLQSDALEILPMTYISETLVPLKSAIKPKKQTRFAGDPVTSVKTIPVRRTRSHPTKWTIKAGDPDLLISIELSQARADANLNQDLRGNLSVMSPRGSHHVKETLPTVPTITSSKE